MWFVLVVFDWLVGFFDLLLCLLLEEFKGKRQKDVFELRNASWRGS